MSSRRPPLHTCAVSFFAIARKTSQKAHDLNGPIRTMVKKSTKLYKIVSPLFSLVQHLLLATLAFVDSYILACEHKVGSLFPQTNYVFNKIDDLVRVTETLPQKYDPFLDWALLHVITWLNFLAPGFVARDVVIDTNYNNRNEESTAEPTSQVCNENEETDARELSYQSDSTVQTVSTEVSDREEAMDGLAGSSKEIYENGENGTSENGSVGKDGLGEEWFEGERAIKPKQAAKRKQKSKKKKN